MCGTHRHLWGRLAMKHVHSQWGYPRKAVVGRDGHGDAEDGGGRGGRAGAEAVCAGGGQALAVDGGQDRAQTLRRVGQMAHLLQHACDAGVAVGQLRVIVFVLVVLQAGDGVGG